MPVSKSRRRKPNKKKPKTKPVAQWGYSKFALKDGQHALFKRATLEAARKSVADFPATLSALNNELKKSDPIGILATLANYGLQTSVSQREGVTGKSLLKDIQQHHVELLQALVLALPVEDWPAAPFTPSVVQQVIDLLPKLTDAFFHQRLLTTEKIDNKVDITLHSLQERMRLHTQGVRNWGYFSEVIRISKELFSPLDVRFSERLGFSASDLIRVMSAAVEEFERRSNAHRETLLKVLKEPTADRIIKAYYGEVPYLDGDPDELLRVLPADISREAAMGLVMGHFDLRLVDIATFLPEDLATTTGIDTTIVTTALKAISLSPGTLASVQTDRLFLGNPVWESPGIDLDDAFFLPIPQVFFSHIYRVMDRLAAESGLKSALENQRAAYLEDQLTKIMSRALPGATIRPSVKWKVGDEQFETDLLVVIDRTVLIAEAKSNRLTASGLRGAPDRLRKHVYDMIVYPSLQSARLQSLIAQARLGNGDAGTIVRSLGINPDLIDQVIRVSVTLDDFSVVSAAESDFKEIGWVPVDHALAPTILIADLVCIVDILDDPLLLLHYLSERIHLQKSFDVMGDELDFLGLYLESGFNIAGLRDENTFFSFTGMSAPIDGYYMSKDAGIELPKPRAKLQPLFARTIAKLNERRSHGWTTAGLHLLSSADPDEQKQIEQKLAQLRIMVRKNFHDPAHLNSLQIRPPEERKAIVAFYLFPEDLRSESKTTMEGLAAQIMDKIGDTTTVVLFGRSIEHWDEPYEMILVVRSTR